MGSKGRRGRARGFLAVVAIAASAVGIVVTAPPASAAIPSIVNRLSPLRGNAAPPGTASFAETQAVEVDSSGNRTVNVTFLVNHDPGRSITQVQWSHGATVNVSPQRVTSTTSLVRAAMTVTTFPSMSCGIFSATRRADQLVTFRVVDNVGEISGSVAQNLRFIEDADCLGFTDYPVLEAASHGHVEVGPGGNVPFSFTCDDPDSSGTGDFCDFIRVRSRSLNDGSVLAEGDFDAEDNVSRSYTVSAATTRGLWVLEAQLFTEDGRQDDDWWHLGSYSVNPTAPTASLGFTGTGVVASTPPSVNAGQAGVRAIGSASSDAQVIQWSGTKGDGQSTNGNPFLDGNLSIVNPVVIANQLQRDIDTSVAGLKTVNLTVTDSGSIDAADTTRKSVSVSAQLRVNALPKANDATVTTDEDTSTSFQLLAGDDDNQPQALSYEIVGAAQGDLSCTAAGRCTYTPVPNSSGTDTFTYRVRDGAPGLNAAWSYSNTARVDLVIRPVNDPPSIQPVSVTTDEDTAVAIDVPVTDIDSTDHTWSVEVEPLHGTAVCGSGACAYLPRPDFFGQDGFVVRVSDGQLTASAAVTIDVRPVNDAPVADDLFLEWVEDEPLEFFPPVSDVDGDPLVIAAAPAANGTVQCSGTVCHYVPNPDFNGREVVSFAAVDPSGARSRDAVVVVEVRPVNDAPVATPVDLTTDEDTPADVPLDGTDVDGDELARLVLTDPANGAVTHDGGPSATYSPGRDYHGPDLFDFRVTDPSGASADAQVRITVNPVNDAPVADDAGIETDEDTSVTFAVAAGDVEGDALTYAVVGQPAHGTVSCVGATCTYEPGPDFFGTDAIQVQVDDGRLADTATVSITVRAVNDAPVAETTTLVLDEDVPAAFQLLATDVDDAELSFVADAATLGSLVCSASGACTYTPGADVFGGETIRFTATDAAGDTSAATVLVTVRPVNDAPVAGDTSITTDEDTAVTFTPHASDVDDAELLLSATDGAHGTVLCAGTVCTYEPTPDFHGDDAFTVAVSDGELEDVATVTVQVAPVNDAPVADDTDVATDEDTPVTFDLPVSDVDGDELTYVVSSAPAAGAVACTAGGCTYQPAPNANGDDAFTVTVSDGELEDVAAVVVHVTAVNDAPVAADTSITTDEDAAVTFTPPASDVDSAGLALTATEGAHGTVVCGTVTCTYTPAPNSNGPDSFTYTVSDGELDATGTVLVDTLPVNDAPTAADLVVGTDEDTPVAVTLAATDVDGDVLAFDVLAPTSGSVSGTAPNLVFTPAPNASGAASFVVVVTDGNGGVDTATVTIQVAEVNDAPVAADGTAANDNQPTVGFTLAASDVDGDAVTFAVTTQPAHGTVTCTTTGACTYTPEPTYSGTDSLVFTASDGRGGSDTGTVTFTVTPGTPQALLGALVAKVTRYAGSGTPDARPHLQKAIERLDAGQVGSACGQLTAAQSQLSSQANRELSAAERAEVLADLARIRQRAGCL